MAEAVVWTKHSPGWLPEALALCKADAAALSAADCGFAVHGEAEASLRAADLYLSEPGLEPLVHLLSGAK